MPLWHTSSPALPASMHQTRSLQASASRRNEQARAFPSWCFMLAAVFPLQLRSGKGTKSALRPIRAFQVHAQVTLQVYILGLCATLRHACVRDPITSKDGGRPIQRCCDRDRNASKPESRKLRCFGPSSCSCQVFCPLGSHISCHQSVCLV